MEKQKQLAARLLASPGVRISPDDQSNVRSRAAARLFALNCLQNPADDQKPDKHIVDAHSLGLKGSWSVEEEVVFQQPFNSEYDDDEDSTCIASATSVIASAVRALSPPCVRKRTFPTHSD
jgi:hypothetical protein